MPFNPYVNRGQAHSKSYHPEQLSNTLLLGTYRVGPIVGKGGMGTVFAGTRVSDDREVAIKVMHPRCAVAPAEVERFEREATILADLDHPHIPNLYDLGETDDGLPCMVIDLYRGSPLRAILSAKGTLGERNVAGIAVQVLEALSHVHSLGIVHRDIKPGNLFVSRGGEGRAAVKLVDFGLAVRPQATELRLTQAGCVAATPSYAAPEQVLRDTLTAQTDIYAVGIVMYRALTGRLPFEEADARQTLMAQVQKPVPLPMWSEFGVSEDLGDLVLWCLEKLPRNRPECALTLSKELRAFAKRRPRREPW